MKNKILGLLQFNIVNRLLRKRRSKLKNQKSKSLGLFGSFLKNIKPFISFKKNRQVFLIGILLTLLFILLFHIYTYSLITPKQYFNSTAQVPELVDDIELNVLVAGVENTNDYSYVKFLNVITINFMEENYAVYSISPYISYNFSSEVQNRFLNVLNQGDRYHIDTISEAVETFLGVRIDRYIAFEMEDLGDFVSQQGFVDGISSSKEFYSFFIDQSAKTSREVVENNNVLFQGILNSHNSFFEQYKTLFVGHITYTDIFRTDMRISELRRLISKFGDLSSVTPTFFAGASDSSISKLNEAIVIRQRDVDKIVREKNPSTLVFTEQPEIEVYNATIIPGYAAKFRREFQNNGINVVKYGNFFEREEENILYITGDPENFTATVESVRRSLEGDVIVSDDEYRYNYTGDLVLVLGQRE